MPIYKIQGPDNHIYQFEGPEDATQAEKINYAMQLYDKRQAEIKANQNKGTAGDIVTAVKQGVAGIPGGLAGLVDIPLEAITGENYVTEAGKKLADVTGIHPSDYAKGLEAEKSAKYQAAQAEANALWDAGKYEDLAKFYATHPSLTATNVAESAPSMLLGGAYSKGLKGVSALAKGITGATTRGAIGEGAVTAGQINQQLGEEGGGSQQKALAALGAGVGTTLIGGASGKLAQRMGIIDPETFLAGRASHLSTEELAQFAKVANQGITKRLGLGAVQEGLLQELPQSVQEQMFQNWGNGKPIMEGVARSAVEGALAGSVMGGGFNVLAGNPAKEQLKAQEEAQAVAAQTQLAQEQRQATGVMEQQPMFTQEQAPEAQGPMPIPEPSTRMETTYNEAGEAAQTPVTVQDITYDKQGSPVYPKTAVEPVPEEQTDLFTAKGKPSPEALASVESARIQGLPTVVAELAGTPEGRAELSSNRKMYFPDLTTKERNAKIVEIQRAGVAPVVEAPVAEGTLTPAILKSFDITPRNKQYKALAGANLTDPTTYNLLTTAASIPNDFGVKANKILDTFPHYNPNAAQRDLYTGEINAPQTQAVKTEPEQQDLFGVQEDGTRVNPIEQAVKPSVAEPVRPEETPVQTAEEPVRRGVEPIGQPAVAGVGQPELPLPNQPSALKSSAFPRVDDSPGISVGPGGMIKPKIVAADNTLHHETNIDGLNTILGDDNKFEYHPIFVSDNPDLAIGQGGNKGIKVQFRPNTISGAEHIKPGTMGAMGDLAGREYKSDIIAPRAISRIDVANKKALNGIQYGPKRVLMQQFDMTTHPDGSYTFLRKGLEAPAIQQPSTLAPVPQGAAKTAAALKKEPVATAWTNITYPDGTPFPPYATLSKLAKNQIKDAHDDGYLSQAEATQIMRREKGNLRVESVNKPEVPIEEEGTKTSATNQTSGTETDMVEAKHVEKNLTGKSQVEAARWIAENAPNKSYRIIAEKVADMLARLKTAGVNQRFTIVHIGDQAPISLGNFGTLGMSEYSWSAKDPYVHVYLKGSDFSDGNIGTTYETALHELIHAATQAAITQGSKVSSTGTEFGKDVDNLITLHNAVIKHFNARIKESEAGGAPLTSFEQSVYKGGANSLKNIKELVSWGLSNPEMQAYMEAIPYKSGRSLWSEFVNTIRNLLGLPVSANTALSELLSVSESLLNTNVTSLKDFAESKGDALHQINPAAQAQARQSIKAMSGTLAQSGPKVATTPTQVAQNIATTMIKNPTGALGMIENMANKVRTAAVDKAAYLSTSIQDHNDGAFRDINGDIRQDMGLSAANNMQNYINAIFTHGGIEILSDKAIRVKTDKHSIDGVFRAGKKLADRIGVDDARSLITGAFYHYRADAIMKLPKVDWPKNWLADPRMVPTPAQIKAGLDAFKQHPELEEMRTQFIGSKNQMVKFLFDAGFLSKGKRDAFLADNSYAPWLRLKEYSDTIPGLGNMGRMVDLSQMKALVGGTEEVNDMLENMAQIIGWFARSGIANHTANQALETMVTMNSAKKFNSRPGSGDPSHTVMTYVDGIPTFWQIDNPYDLAAFQTVKGLDSPAMRTIGRALGTLRAGIVLFPAFPLRQVVMDSQRAFVQSGVEHPWPMMGKIFKTFLSGEAYKANAKDIETLRKYGVVGGIDFNAHDTTRGRAKQFGLTEPGNTLTDKWMRSPAYQFLHTLAYSADLSVRLGIFRQTMEETGDEVLAATRAREIINFQKSGTSELLHTLKQTIPFLGAYLQGMDVNYRSMIGRGNSMKARKAAAAAYWGNMAMYAGLVVAYTMCMSGDDEYEDQKGFITDRNFLIPGVGLLPVPTDVGFLGKVIPERITDYILQEGTEDPESAKRLRSGIIQAAGAGFLPPMAVYGVTPALEIVFNKSFFSDMPIVGQYYQGLEKKEQYTPNTSGFARAVGEVLNQSPLQIDYVLNAIGGTSAGAILQLADVMAGDGKMAADRTPIISTFQMKTVGGRYAEEYYAVRELTEQAYKTQQAMAERGDIEGREEYLARPEIQARLSARPGIESIHTQLNAIQHQRKAIENSDLDPQAKRDAVNALLANVEANLKAARIREQRVAVE